MTYAPSFHVYLLTTGAPQKFVLDFLDSRPEVRNWFSLFPGTILVTSISDLTALTGLFHASYPWLHFLLAELDPSRINGFANAAVWDFINNPKSSGRWE
jgi:hypothetical protein